MNIKEKEDGDLTLDQQDYINSLMTLLVSSNTSRSGMLTEEGTKQYRGIVDQLYWISTQTRLDISFDVCQLSSVFDKDKLDDVLRVN